MAHRLKLLLAGGVARRRCDKEKYLVGRKCSVRLFLSRDIDGIAGSQRHFFWCDFSDRNIWSTEIV
jgi:hypothetical protein